jgi:hypothetical protein
MQIKKLDLHRVLLFAGGMSLILVYLLSWVDVITDPVQRTGSDFIAFYAAGKNMVEYTPAAAYDLPYLKTQEESVIGFKIADQDVNPFVHPPFILPILWLVAYFDYIPAFYMWAAFMLIACVLSAQIAVKSFAPVENVDRIALWMGVFLFFPLFISLVNGQDSAVLLLGAMIWYYGLVHHSDKTAGLGLALTTIRPQIALLLAIPFFFNASRRNVWWWFCLGGAILVSISILIIGVEGAQNFLSILSVSASGEGYKINEIAMVNLIGLIKRLLPGLDATVIRTIGWAGSLTSLITLSLIWKYAHAITGRLISLAVIMAIFTSPHLHYHDLALLVIPLLVATHRLITTQKAIKKSASLLLMCASFVLLFTYSIPQLKYAVVYLIELAVLGFLWLLGNGSEPHQDLVGHQS